jgi:hypothetical protein
VGLSVPAHLILRPQANKKNRQNVILDSSDYQSEFLIRQQFANLHLGSKTAKCKSSKCCSLRADYHNGAVETKPLCGSS